MTRSLMILAASFALSACGGDAERRADRGVTEGTATAPGQTTGAERASSPSAPEGKPIVTVRVEGPMAVDPQMQGQHRVGATRYEAVVRMHNEGDRPAELSLAHVDFEAWSEDGQRIACVSVGESTLDNPPLLQPNEMHSLRSAAVCHFPEPGEYEVRAYVSFGAEAPEADLELARYYAGRTPVRVVGG